MTEPSRDRTTWLIRTATLPSGGRGGLLGDARAVDLGQVAGAATVRQDTRGLGGAGNSSSWYAIW